MATADLNLKQWPPEWFETFKSSFTCKAELGYKTSSFWYPTEGIREHAKTMALLMGLRVEVMPNNPSVTFPYGILINHDQ